MTIMRIGTFLTYKSMEAVAAIEVVRVVSAEDMFGINSTKTRQKTLNLMSDLINFIDFCIFEWYDIFLNDMIYFWFLNISLFGTSIHRFISNRTVASPKDSNLHKQEWGEVHHFFKHDWLIDLFTFHSLIGFACFSLCAVAVTLKLP